MKKVAALLLVLCMLLTAVPVLGEEAGPGGNWYLTLADVTLGYILLNEDGTAVMNIVSEEDITGTWTADGTVVTITAAGQPVDFTYDGTSLKSDLIPLALTREEGRLPMDVISKMMGGEEYELPEGMTEADMTMIALNFLSEYTKLMEEASDQDGGDTPAGTAEPAAKPEAAAITIDKSTFKVTESYSGFRGTYIARIKNENDYPLFVTGGSMQVFDAEEKRLPRPIILPGPAPNTWNPGKRPLSVCLSIWKMTGNIPSKRTLKQKRKAIAARTLL